MKILGIGTDIVNIKRINKILQRNTGGFKKKVFSKSEINYCDKKKSPASFYAKRYAAKEAFTKALGTGISKGVSLKNIEIFNDTRGKPEIKLKGELSNILKKRIKNNRYKIYLSLSDDNPWAQATVIISYK
tara:strand:- start:473 stop:865 length:393 start_codon:yes stop_codon:yes gene_type:complete